MAKLGRVSNLIKTPDIENLPNLTWAAKIEDGLPSRTNSQAGKSPGLD
jgi:hypothetical protein